MEISNNSDLKKGMRTASAFSALCFSALLSQTAQGLELKDPIKLDSSGKNCSINKNASVARRDATWSDLEKFITIRDNEFQMERISNLRAAFSGVAIYQKHYFQAQVALNNKDGEREARRVIQSKNEDIDVHGVELVVRAVSCNIVQKPLFRSAGYIELDLRGGKHTYEVSRAVSATRETVSGFSWTTTSTVSSTQTYGGSASFGFSFKGISGGAEAHYERSNTYESGTSSTRDGSTTDGLTTTDTNTSTIEFENGDEFYGVLPKHDQVIRKVPFVEIEFEESLEGWVVYHCPDNKCNGHYYMASPIGSAIKDFNDFFKDGKRGVSYVMADTLKHKVESIVDDPENYGTLLTTSYMNDKEGFNEAKRRIEKDAPWLRLIPVDFGDLH